MGIKSLTDTLHNGSCIDKSQLQEWRRLYPYFSLPLMMYTQQHYNDDKDALALSVIYTGDIDEWATQLGIKPCYNQLYPSSSHSAITTDSTIDLFLQTYGKDNEYETELSIPAPIEIKRHDDAIDDNDTTRTPLLTIPAYDYMSQLESMPDAEDATLMQGDDLLEKFLQADAAGEQLFSRPEYHPAGDTSTILGENDTKEGNDTLFSESLAKIYIQQRRYAKALEIIRKLNLNNPEKNIYFADQIRFLEKLIINVKN
ncbi:MAG: hypothetical protein IKA91_05470 [Bacteroidaceae bacterium]|nr:hypothetical protein [Bacteroidaceae bacterium]